MDRLQDYIKDFKNIKLRGGALIATDYAPPIEEALLYALFLNIISKAADMPTYRNIIRSLLGKPVAGRFLPLSASIARPFTLAAAKAFITAEKLTGPNATNNINKHINLAAYMRAPVSTPLKFAKGQKVTVNGIEGTIEDTVDNTPAVIRELDAYKMLNTTEYVTILNLLIDAQRTDLTPADRTTLKLILDEDLIRAAPSGDFITAMGLYGISLGPFYKVKLESGVSLWPVYDIMVTASSRTNSTNAAAYVDYGEPVIPILDVSVHKLGRNNNKIFLANKPVNRYTTVKTLLDQVRDANPSTRCLVSSGGMFVTSLGPSDYYSSFDSLGIKHQALELELIN